MNLSVCLSVLFPVNMKQNYLNYDPEDARAYTGHPVFNITKNVTCSVIVKGEIH